MNVDPKTLRSRADFSSDAAYQAWSKTWLESMRLNDGYRYSVNVLTGSVSRGQKMNLPVQKFSKSS